MAIPAAFLLGVRRDARRAERPPAGADERPPPRAPRVARGRPAARVSPGSCSAGTGDDRARRLRNPHLARAGRRPAEARRYDPPSCSRSATAFARPASARPRPDRGRAATKIRPKYLRALEDEQFELLPAQTYVKGFLSTYAEFLGLDGQLYVDEYNSRYVTREEEVPLRPRRSNAGRRRSASPRVERRARGARRDRGPSSRS